MPQKRVLHENICSRPYSNRGLRGEGAIISHLPLKPRKGEVIVKRFEDVKPGVHIFAIIDSTEMVFDKPKGRTLPAKRPVKAKVIAVHGTNYECEIIDSVRSDWGRVLTIPHTCMML